MHFLLLLTIVGFLPTAEREKATSVAKINFMLIWQVKVSLGVVGPNCSHVQKPGV